MGAFRRGESTPAAGSPRGAPIFVSWCRFHGRSDGIARALGVTAWFADGGRGPVAVRDVRRWRQTRRLLAVQRPGVVIVMQPPFFALWCVLRYVRATGALLIGDLHTGVFLDPKGILARRLTLRLVRRYGFAIVTNDVLKRLAEQQHCDALVLHDVIEVGAVDNSTPTHAGLAALPEATFVLVPLAYAYDEPVRELLAAARATPEIRWVLTGDAPERVRSAAPANVLFSGYLSHADYIRALSRAGVVVAMTTRLHTMQRAAYEALCFGRPLVAANTAVLADYYRDAAQIVQPCGADIAAGVLRAFADDRAAERMTALRSRRIAEQKKSLDELRGRLAAGARWLATTRASVR